MLWALITKKKNPNEIPNMSEKFTDHKSSVADDKFLYSLHIQQTNPMYNNPNLRRTPNKTSLLKKNAFIQM